MVASRPGSDSHLKQLDAWEAQAAILRGLGLVRDSRSGDHSLIRPPRLVIDAAAVRAALWAASAAGRLPVYVTRLLHVAAGLVEPLYMDPNLATYGAESSGLAARYPPPDLSIEPNGAPNRDAHLRSRLRAILDELAELGDAVELPRGRWIPAPLRCVYLSMTERLLLVGGRPTHCLPTTLGQNLEHAGLCRLLHGTDQDLGQPLPTQDLSAWCGRPSEPLLDWTKQVIENTELVPQALTETRFELYVPAPRFGQSRNLQYYRWTNIKSVVDDGRYLARYRLRFGAVRYVIVEIRHGRPSSVGEPDLGDGDLRRLLYGLDALAGRPITVPVEHVSGKIRFRIESELPRAELRLFTALGTLTLPSPDRYYPRFWDFPVECAEQAEQALGDLGVIVRGQDHHRPRLRKPQ